MSPGTRSKASATRERIHKCALRLFAEHGYRDTHITDIAAAAGVSVRTIHVHYPSKEAIVYGDAEPSIGALSELIASGAVSPVQAVQQWLVEIAPGWLEPEVRLQWELAEQIPGVERERARLLAKLGTGFRHGFAREFGVETTSSSARMAAAVMIAALEQIERTAILAVHDGHALPSEDDLALIVEDAARFIAAGRAALGSA